MCEDHISEFTIDTKKMITELRKCLETFEKYWAIYEKVIVIT